MVDMQAVADKLQSEVLGVERRQALRLTRRYAQTYKRLRTAMLAVTEAIEGNDQVPQDVMSMPAFQTFMDSTIRELNQFGFDAYAEIVDGIKRATEIGIADAETLMLAPVAQGDRGKARGLLKMPTPSDLQEASGLA